MTDMTNGRRNDDGSVTPWNAPVPQFDPVPLVADFQRIFETPNDPELWADLIREETNELLEAMGDTKQDTARAYYGNVLKEASDVIYVVSGFANVVEASANPREAAAALDVTTYETGIVALDEVFSLIGPDMMEEAFKLVHQSNLSKLLSDGTVLRRADGKVLKGPNYLPPDMGPLADRLYADLQGTN